MAILSYILNTKPVMYSSTEIDFIDCANYTNA